MERLIQWDFTSKSHCLCLKVGETLENVVAFFQIILVTVAYIMFSDL